MVDQSSTQDPATDGTAVGLPAGMRYRCDGCGNLTRFDVTVAERSTRFWHVAVSGEGRIESSDVASQEIQSVTCRWCGSADLIVTERAPLGETTPRMA